MLAVIIILGFFLGVILSNTLAGMSISFGFWVFGWFLTRPHHQSKQKTIEGAKKRIPQKSSGFFNVNSELKYSILEESTVVALGKTSISATKLFSLSLGDFLEVRELLEDLGDSGIPIFYYVFFEDTNPSLISDQTKYHGILGVRLSQQIKAFNQDNVISLVSKTRMAGSRLKKVIKRLKADSEIRELIDYDLLQAFRKIMIGPVLENKQAKKRSLWVKLDHG